MAVRGSNDRANLGSAAMVFLVLTAVEIEGCVAEFLA